MTKDEIDSDVQIKEVLGTKLNEKMLKWIGYPILNLKCSFDKLSLF